MSPESPPPEPAQLTNVVYSSAGEEDSDEFQDETVGKSAGKRSEFNSLTRNTNHNHTANEDRQPRKRPRPQSTYAGVPPTSSVAPLQPRLRSRSTAGLGISDGTGKFIDPLVLRRQEKERNDVANKKGKKAVGDLVAFFDGGEK
jgi:hypothetical protein